MAPTSSQAPDAHRPSMRRKSSAQNLLSSFKRTESSATVSSPSLPNQPNALPSIVGVPIAGLSYVAPTPTAAVMPRDWDAQSYTADSVHSSATASSGSTLIANGSPALGTAVAKDGLRVTICKRIAALTYMRNVHDGRCHWFHTVAVTRNDLDRVFNNHDMKKRTPRFAVLGMSLGALFDVQGEQFLASLLAVLNEYEASREEGDRPKMGRLFRGKPGKRPGLNADFASTAEMDNYLVQPHMPFPLDYHETLLSLLDILSELYNKILKILGPSASDASGGGIPVSATTSMRGNPVMMGPLGSLSPHPGVSYLFSQSASGWGVASGAATAGVDEFGGLASGVPPLTAGLPGIVSLVDRAPDNSLQAIANATNTSAGFAAPGTIGGTNGMGSEWKPGMGELVQKIDGKLKKLISTLLKDLDTFARNSIQDELATLDPLLRNVTVADGAREQFDFEGAI